MKYSHLGFSQKVAIEMGLDDKDLAILRWFVDFKDSKKITKKIFDNEVFYWVKYEAIIEEYPIFKFKKDTVYRRLKTMVKKGILKHRTLKQGGVWSYYTLGEKYIKLISDEVIDEEKEVGNESEPFGNESEGNGTISESNGLKSGTKNPSTISIYHNINSAKEDVEEIWRLYPNKKGRAQAIKKIPKILNRIGKEQLIRCIERYTKEIQGKDKQFILNGSTFFNGRYEDYVDAAFETKDDITKEKDKPKEIEKYKIVVEDM